MLFRENVVLNMLAKCCKESIFALADKYHISPYDVMILSVTCIKENIDFCFYFLVIFSFLCCVLD